MNKAYHLTPRECSEDIKRSGYLEPRTNPMIFEHFAFMDGFLKAEHKVNMGCNSRFVVGALDSPDFQDWKEHGLYERLIERVSSFWEMGDEWYDKKVHDELSVLSFPVPDTSFVRDHGHISPKTFMEVCGKDLWYMISHGGLQTEKRGEIFLKQLEKYYMSVTRITSYDGGFQVPEVWVPEPVSSKNIEEVYTFKTPKISVKPYTISPKAEAEKVGGRASKRFINVTVGW